MTAEIPYSDTQPERSIIERDDPRDGQFSQYMIDRLDGELPVASPADRVQPRYSRRGGRALPEEGGRDKALEFQPTEEERANAAGPDSVPKAITFLAVQALRGKNYKRYGKLMDVLDAHERGEKVDLASLSSLDDDDEVA